MTANTDLPGIDRELIDRRTALKSIAGSAALAAGLCSRSAWAMTAPVVATAYGKVRGTTADGIHIFKGVRYGAPTGGANRFMPPRKPAPWTGIRDALHYGNSAPQTNPNAKGGAGALFAPVGGDEKHPESEDCLFLNVWTPGVNDARKAPGDGVAAWRRIPVRVRLG